MDYEILTSGTTPGLERSVNEKIGQGYVLAGGTILETSPSHDRPYTEKRYVQAVYKPQEGESVVELLKAILEQLEQGNQ